MSIPAEHNQIQGYIYNKYYNFPPKYIENFPLFPVFPPLPPYIFAFFLLKKSLYIPQPTNS